VWRLRADCHRAKTDNWPDAGGWLVKFIEHCNFYGYEAAAEKARARLEGMLSVRKAVAK
jgi:hypothetical protein